MPSPMHILANYFKFFNLVECGKYFVMKWRKKINI